MRRSLGPRACLSYTLASTLLAAALVAAPAGAGAVPAPSAATRPSTQTYHNPMAPDLPDSSATVDSCADPTVLRGQDPDHSSWWYMYCTTDPLNDQDVEPGTRNPRFHPIPMMRSHDLVHWTYLGDALPKAPDWAAEGAGLWAPDVVYSSVTRKYYMTFVVTNTDDDLRGTDACHSDGDSAIAVAVADSPTGPWVDSGKPLVAPRRDPDAPPENCSFFWTYDPDVLGDTVAGTSTIYYGSYYGGIHASNVAFDSSGASTVGEPTRIAIGNRYEGSNVVQRAGWYYLFASATDCCNGPLTSYGVFAGRSRNPLGPFRDKEGQPLTAGRVGGTPVLLPNGNRWQGVGHNSVFRDAAGRWWTMYHAIDRNDPYFPRDFAANPGFERRAALLDPLDWVNGWPKVRAGRGASDTRMPAPASSPARPSAYRAHPPAPVRLGRFLPAYSDDFRDGLEGAWRWTGSPVAEEDFAVAGGALRWNTQDGDIARDSNKASILTRNAPPTGDFVVQTRVKLDVPPEGCCHNYVQAGVVLHQGKDEFIKLVHVSIWETRQTEFAKEVPTAPAEGLPVYGNGVVGPPGDTTTLRIVVDRRPGPDFYTAYTRQDGRAWVRGGTWTHTMSAPRIGLISLGAPERFTARFLDVTTWRLR